MIDINTGAIKAPIVTRLTNDRHTLKIEIDIEDYYTIVNSLTDSCGCVQCGDLARKLQTSLRDNSIASLKP